MFSTGKLRLEFHCHHIWSLLKGKMIPGCLLQGKGYLNSPYKTQVQYISSVQTQALCFSSLFYGNICKATYKLHQPASTVAQFNV